MAGLEAIAQPRIRAPENKALESSRRTQYKPLGACAVTPPQGEQINRALLSQCGYGTTYTHIYEYRH